MKMPISRATGLSDVFEEELSKFAQKLPGTDLAGEKRLEKTRDESKSKVGTEEVLLENNRVDGDVSNNLIEKNLRKHTPKSKDEGVTEKRLDEKKGSYPHRNPEAWKRTKEKRPVNALDEEMGDAGDASKKNRFDKASKADQPKRILDKDIGKQLTEKKTKIKKAFNLKSKRSDEEQSVSGYLNYRQAKNNKTFNAKFAKADELRSMMAEIMKKGALSDEDKRDIDDLKEQLSELLGIRQ